MIYIKLTSMVYCEGVVKRRSLTRALSPTDVFSSITTGSDSGKERKFITVPNNSLQYNASQRIINMVEIYNKVVFLLFLKKKGINVLLK